MDADEKQLLKSINELLYRITLDRSPCKATQAVLLLSNRFQEAFQTFDLLRSHAKHDWTMDGGTILRGLYDAMLQACYIVCKPSEAQARGLRYLAFEWIEREHLLNAFSASPSWFTRKMLSSPLRTASEPAIRAEVAKLKPMFSTSSGTKLHLNWYGPHKLDKLADDTGNRDEYNVIQKMLSGVVHSSSFWVKGRCLPRKHFPFFAIRLQFRVLGRLAALKGTDVYDEEKRAFKHCDKNLLG